MAVGKKIFKRVKKDPAERGFAGSRPQETTRPVFSSASNSRAGKGGLK